MTLFTLLFICGCKEKISFCGENWTLDTKEIFCEQDKVPNLSPLVKLKRLEHLKITFTGIGGNNLDLTPLRQIGNLESLDVLFAPLYDIEPLRDLKKLEYLSIADSQVKDFGALFNLVNLKVLGLYGTECSDLSFLKKLKKLERLFIGTEDLTDISRISHLKKLKYFFLNEFV